MIGLDGLADLDLTGADWKLRGTCAQTDADAFYPERGGNTLAAKRVCMSCEVRVQCLDYALANGERWGVWGGKSERERRALERRQRTQVAA